MNLIRPCDFAIILTIVLEVLKVTGQATLTWLQVASPCLVLMIIGLMIAFIIMLMSVFVKGDLDGGKD